MENIKLIRFLARAIEAKAFLEATIMEKDSGQKFSEEEKDKIYCDSIEKQLTNLLEEIPEINKQIIYNCLQLEEIQSDKNKYHAAEKLNRLPDDNEATLHYIQSGRAADFAKRFRKTIYGQVPS